MSSQSVGKYVPTRRVSWLSTTYRAMRSYATSSNLIGLICGVAVIFLLLVPPLPWNIRLPLYLIVLVWTNAATARRALLDAHFRTLGLDRFH